MKIVCIDGGLGNQMFKYAFALVLREKHPNQKILIDTRLCRWRKPQAHNGYELDKLFNIEIKEASLWDIYKVSKRAFGIILYKINKKWYQRYIEHFYDYKDENYVEDYLNPCTYNENYLTDKSSLYYDCTAQAWQYLQESKSLLQSAFQFKKLIDDYNLSIRKEMIIRNSVAVHFRFGDYLEHPELNICSVDYYLKAFRVIKEKVENPFFYVFTNDIDYFCKEMMDKLNIESNTVKIINHNIGQESYKDIFLMSSCKNIIIANSSFSWWGAWLGDNDKRIIVAPQKWMNTFDCVDICPKNWIRL